jgi:hypothetical protein
MYILGEFYGSIECRSKGVMRNITRKPDENDRKNIRMNAPKKLASNFKSLLNPNFCCFSFPHTVKVTELLSSQSGRFAQGYTQGYFVFV